MHLPIAYYKLCVLRMSMQMKVTRVINRAEKDVKLNSKQQKVWNSSNLFPSNLPIRFTSDPWSQLKKAHKSYLEKWYKLYT